MFFRARILRFAFLLGLLALVACSGLFESAHAEGNPQITVLDLNIWAGAQEMDFERLAIQIERVRKINPDVLLLQEAYDKRAKAMYIERFPDYDVICSDGPPPTNFLFRSMNGLVSSMVYAHRYVGIFPYAAGTREMFQGDSYGLMILVRKGSDRRVVPDSKVLHTYRERGSTPFSKAGFVDALKPRAFLAVQYEVAGVPMLIVNTHWSNGVKNPMRINVARELVSEIKKLQSATKDGSAMPVILGMDSNAHADPEDGEPEMLYLHNHAKDSFLEVNPNVAASPYGGRTWTRFNTNTLGRLIEPDQRVDCLFTFMGGNFFLRTLSSRIVLDRPPFVSDHLGLYSVLELAPTPCALELLPL